MKSFSSTINRLTSLLSQTSSDLVACNVYVSAGKRQHAEPLLNVLKSSQELCQKLRQGQTKTNDDDGHQNTSNRRIAIIHAYADGPYDRSSFHLAGCAECVALVASHVAMTAIDALQPSLLHQAQSDDADAPNSKHPLVGIVDHVSIMPLVQLESTIETSRDTVHVQTRESQMQMKSSDKKEMHEHDHIYIPSDAQGLAALYVAHKLTQRGVQCYPYGTADQNHTPLATVRKQKTSFFNSGGLALSMRSNMKDEDYLGICTVGSPMNFVENFNVRLTSHISRKQAMTLTKKVRERDGGVIGVEALTLPYSEDRFEVACNLLQPNIGSADCVMKKVKEWIDEQQLIIATGIESSLKDGNPVQDGDNCNYTYYRYIDEAYRVGTTVEQCMSVLVENEDNFEVHDAMVLGNFEKFLHTCS